MGKIIIAANRLPITVTQSSEDFNVEQSAGGLATALKSAFPDKEIRWVGWPGCFPKGQKSNELQKILADMSITPVMPKKADFDGFYQHYSNGILWPVFHYLVERVPTKTSGFSEYYEVNRMFAEAIIAEYEPGDVIWVHDYHLMLVPKLVRSALKDAPIGFFLHIPFPSFEVFRVVPECKELLEGVMGADLIGFHTPSYVDHFQTGLKKLLHMDSNEDRYKFDHHYTKVDAFPIGIDFDFFNKSTAMTEFSKRIAAMKETSPDLKIFMAVDRLDYTKGVLRRLNAFEEMLKSHPDIRGKVVLIQVGIKTRSKVREYAKFKRQVDEYVGRINGEFGDVDYQAVHYVAHGFSQTELAVLYRNTDVMLVTPIRDGMNLVAKEFVASKRDDDGVLVLSEFAGAAEDLTEALMVNPYDTKTTAQTMYKATIMDKSERNFRMRSLRTKVEKFQNSDWAQSFLKALKHKNRHHEQEGQMTVMNNEQIDSLALECAQEKEILLLLDYDGTLVPIQESPDQAVPDQILCNSLRNLAVMDGVDVHIVSGRRRQDLETWFSDLPINLHGEHGVWERLAKSDKWKCTLDDNIDVKNIIKPLAEEFAELTPGSFVEEKSHGISWHYRQCDKELAAKNGTLLIEKILKILPDEKVNIMRGKEVLEFQPSEISKGGVANRLRSESMNKLIVAVGDDVSDEEMFKALSHRSVTMHVGNGETGAGMKFDNVDSVRRFLGKFIDYRSEQVGAVH